MNDRPKIYYLDHIRILLTVLVVLHHSVIAYGGSGSWYYKEKNPSLIESVLMLMFNAVNQSFFMGMFFFMSALFISSSWRSKGTVEFVVDRLRRLGIPLVFYSLILSPSINFIADHYGRGDAGSFFNYLAGYRHWVDFGVLWFVAALLIFTFVYLGLGRSRAELEPTRPAPSDRSLLAWSLVIGAVSFGVRILFPVGWTLSPVGFQLAHFTQYISFFIAGILASKNGWLAGLPGRSVRFWALSAFAGILFFPFLYVVKEVTDSPLPYFSGGFHWQSLVVSFWEQFTGISISMLLLVYGSRAWASPSDLVKRLSRATYAVYIFHPLVVVLISVLIKSWPLDPALKFLILGMTALPVCFAFSSQLVRTPGVRDIL